MNKHNPRWWLPYTFALVASFIGFVFCTVWAEHDHFAAVMMVGLFGTVCWMVLAFKIAGFADNEMKRQHELWVSQFAKCDRDQ